MYTITSEQFASLTFGIPLFVIGVLIIFLTIREVIKYGMDEGDLIVSIMAIALLSVGAVMILAGLGILVIVWYRWW